MNTGEEIGGFTAEPISFFIFSLPEGGAWVNTI
jgi:hypothetical protein